MGVYTEQLEILYDAGGRNFVVLNVPRKSNLSPIPRDTPGLPPSCQRTSLIPSTYQTSNRKANSTCQKKAINESPLMLEQGATAMAQEAASITQYNDLLASTVSNFSSSHSGVTAKVVDTVGPFETALDNPTAYGAANATCYDDDGTTCLWWNNYHPGQASKFFKFFLFVILSEVQIRPSFPVIHRSATIRTKYCRRGKKNCWLTPLQSKDLWPRRSLLHGREPSSAEREGLRSGFFVIIVRNFGLYIAGYLSDVGRDLLFYCHHSISLFRRIVYTFLLQTICLYARKVVHDEW